MEPNAVVEITEESEARALVRLIEALEDHDDIEGVHANFDIPEALLEQVAA
jgi:transcriptional/translational regulatory protein YebC/TACO1